MLSKNVDLNNTVILVTGAAGFVGANLVMSLLSEAEGKIGRASCRERV